MRKNSGQVRIRFFGAFVLLGLLFSQAGACFPQSPSIAWGVDWSAKLDYLFGTQQVREAVSPNYWNSWPDRLRADYNPGFWVISGVSEVSVPRISVRFRGSANVPSENDIARFTFTALTGPSLGGAWPCQTQFISWDVTGSYHFLYDGIYRFAFCGGYRQDRWNRAGAIGDDQLRDRIFSSIPFVGFTAAIFLPAWSGRWELIGSPFMNESFSLEANEGISYSAHSGNANRGGLIEMQFSGTGSITANFLWGIDLKYTFVGLYGSIDGSINSVRQGPYDGYIEHNIGQVGVHLTWLM